MALLNILQDRGRELGVQHALPARGGGLDEFADSDLIVVADGINSRIREKHKEHFEPSVDLRPEQVHLARLDQAARRVQVFLPRDAGRPDRRALLPVRARPLHLGDRDRRADLEELRLRQALGDRDAAGDRERVRRRARRPQADRQPLAVAQLSRPSPTRPGSWATRCWWATPRPPRISRSARAPSWRWKMPLRSSRRSGSKSDVKTALKVYDTAAPRGGREDAARRQRVARLVRAHAALLGHGAGAVRLRRDVALEADHLGEPASCATRRSCADVHRWFARKVKAAGLRRSTSTNPPVPMFTPFRLRDMVLENRVVVSPMDQYSAVDGVPGDWHLVHLGSRAIGGAGLVYVEMTCPSPEARISPGCTGLWNEAQRDAFKRIVDFCHAQLEGEAVHAARPLRAARARRSSAGSAWTIRSRAGNWPLVSRLADPLLRGRLAGAARARRAPRWSKIVADFVRSARYADAGGLRHARDPHGARLPARELHLAADQPAHATSTAASIENRMRFPLEVFRACRAAWPEKQADVGAHLGDRLGARAASPART